MSESNLFFLNDILKSHVRSIFYSISRKHTDIIKAFLAATSIHGLAYLGCKKTSLASKLFWFFLIIVMLGTGCLIIQNALKNWEENPVLTTLDNVAQSMDNVPYPTVTVCPQMGYDRWEPVVSKLNEITEECLENEYESCKAVDKFDFLLEDLKDKFLALVDKAVDDYRLIAAPYHLSNFEVKSGVREYLTSILVKNETILEGLDQVLWESLYKGKQTIYKLLDMPINHKFIYEENHAFQWPNANISMDEQKIWNVINKITFFISFSNPSTFGGLLKVLLPYFMGRSFTAPDGLISPYHNDVYDYTYYEEEDKSDYEFFYDRHELELSTYEAKLHSVLAELSGFENISLFEIPAILNPTTKDPNNFEDREVDKLYPYSARAHNNKGITKVAQFLATDRHYFGNMFSQNISLLNSITVQAVQGNSRNSPNKLILFASSFATKPPYPKPIPSITDKGYCQSYNALPIETIFQNDMPYMKILPPKTLNTPDIDMITSSGVGSRRVFILNSNKSFKDTDDDQASYSVSIGSLYNFMHTSSLSAEVNAGQHLKIQVTPTQYVTSDNFKNIPAKKRNCLYLDENPNPDSIFKFYSQKSCILECQLELSYQRTGCYPWFAPHRNISVAVCDGYQSHYFLNKALKGTCDCPANCEEVVFQMKETYTKINAKKECRNIKTSRTHLKKKLSLKLQNDIMRYGLLFWRFHLLKHNKEIKIDRIPSLRDTSPDSISKEEWEEICLEYVKKDIALLEVEIAVPQMQSIKREKRVNFSDQLGMLG